ncbi:NifB/NifX family molybdenum-iron cluster-binding protein [Bacterioplanoides sp.]|uniref:NifB/NifX family molybdenum-iron cluster-binding protein n=1 Tax=Bacterioplanoides sp. TaxID=2066072 RepID=UPI003B00AD64
MKIAVASLNGETVCGQPGRCRTFILFDTDGFEVLEQENIKFSEDYILQGFDPEKSHPVDKIDVLIASALGEGLVNQLQQRDVIAVATSVKDAAEAAQRFLDGDLPIKDAKKKKKK